MVPSSRKLRYKDKFEHGRKRIDNIKDWINDIREERTKLAVYKAIQELVEVLTDITAMIIKDINLNPRDDYSNFKKLREVEILSVKDENTLKESNGLRNRLIHHYNGIDDLLAINSFKEIFSDIQDILKKYEVWMEGHIS